MNFVQSAIRNPQSAILLSLWCAAASAAEPIPIADVSRTAPVAFTKDVLPILRKSCLACHNASDAYGELVLESPETIEKGGDSGAVVVPGKSEESLLLAVASHAAKPLMPPPDNDVAAAPLTPEELGILKLWIDEGAKGGTAGDSLSPRRWRPLPPGVNPIYAVAATPDGQYAACGRANQIFIYHVPTGTLVTRLTDPELAVRTGDPLPGIAHLDIVQSLTFNGEGDLLASGGFRVVKLWRRPRDVRRLDLTLAEAQVRSVAVSPDGSVMAAGTMAGSIKLFDVKSGEPLGTLDGHASEVTSVGFSPGGRLVSGSKDKTIRIWDPSAGRLLGRIDTPGEVRTIAVVPEEVPVPADPDAQGDPPPPIVHYRIAAGGGDNLIRLWQMPDALPRPLPQVPEQTRVIALSGDESLLALASAQGTLRVIEQESGRLVHTWQAHDAPITQIAFPPPVAAASSEEDAAPRVLATSSADGTVRTWNVDTGEHLSVLRGRPTSVGCVAWGPGDRLISGDEDGSITLWNASGPPPRGLAKLNDAEPVSAVTIDGKLLATAGTSDGRAAIFLRDVTTGELTRTILGHDARVTALSFSADGTRLASGSADKTARVWDLADLKFPEAVRFGGHGAEVQAVALSPNGQQVLSGGSDGSVASWNAATGEPLAEPAAHKAAVVGAAILPNGQTVTASADKTISIFSASDGKPIRAIPSAAPITAMTASRDGAKVAVALNDHSIHIFQLADGKPLATLAGHQEAIHSLAFSADGSRLVSSADNRAIVWDTANGRLFEMLPSPVPLGLATYGTTNDTVLLGDVQGRAALHTLHFALALGNIAQPVTGVAFSANGQIAYAASTDGTVRGFNTTNGQQAFAANHGAPIHDLALSPNGQILATAGEDQLVKLWNAANGAAAAVPQLAGFTAAVGRVSFTTDSAKVIAASRAEPPELLVFDVAAGALEQVLVGHDAVIDDVTATANKVVSTAGDDVRNWPLLAMRRLAGHTQPVTSLAAIPGASLGLFSGSEDGTVRHWNAAAGQVVRQMNHGGPVTDVAARPDGQRFASTSSNNTVKLWNAANGQQLAEMKGDLRADARAAKLQQEQTAAQAKLKAASDALAAAEKDLPVKTEAEKTASEALAAADKDVAEKKASLEAAVAAKSAAEKLAIEMASAAQKSALVMADAGERALATAEAAKIAAQKAAQAKSLADASPQDEALAKLAVQSAEVATEAAEEAKLAEAAKAAPEKAAADAAARANDAAAKAVATNKPFTDASAALAKSADEQRIAAQAQEIAARELKGAAEAVPAAKAAVAAREAKQKEIEAALEAANEAAMAAQQPVRAVAFSPDGKKLLTGGDLGIAHAWDAETGTPVASYAGHAGPILDLAAAPDDELITVSADSSTGVWVLNPGWVLERTIGDVADPAQLASRVRGLDFSDDGSLLATGGGEPSRSGEVKIWRVDDGSLVRAISDAHNDSVLAVEFSRDGGRIASAGADKYVRTFDVASGDELRKFEGHTHHVLGVSWRSDGRELASAGADDRIRIWNAETGDRIREIAGFGKQVTSVTYIGQTGNTISSSGDRTVRMHNTANGQNFRNFGGATDFVYSVDITPDGRIVVAGGFDSILRIWNGTNAQALHNIEPPVESEPKVSEQTVAP